MGKARDGQQSQTKLLQNGIKIPQKAPALESAGKNKNIANKLKYKFIC